MITAEFLSQLKKLNLIIEKRITSSFLGERKSYAIGSGNVFQEFRHYTPGEDYRLIDWKLFAKTEKLFVKKFEEDRAAVAHILLDGSASMAFKTIDISKFEYGARIALALAYLAKKENEIFYFSTFSNKVEHFKSKHWPLLNLINYLNKISPSGETRFENALKDYKTLIKRKSIIFIISDFFYPIEEIDSILFRLRKSEINLIQIVDPFELKLNVEGDYKLEDLETKEKLRTFFNPALKKKYFEKFFSHTKAIQNICDKVKAKFFSFETNLPIFDAIWRLINSIRG